jgi:hypothetical protein
MCLSATHIKNGMCLGSVWFGTIVLLTEQRTMKLEPANETAQKLGKT